MTTCSWWRAWWHRRLRQTDRDMVWPRLLAGAHSICPEDSETALVGALSAWAAFIQQPGQEHWHCACAEAEPPIY